MPKFVQNSVISAKPNQKTLKIVIFAVGRLHLALPIYTVRRIINQVQVSRSGLNHFGVAHLGETEITVIDLHQRLFHEENSQSKIANNYLIVAQNNDNEILGIEVPTTPTIEEIPANKIRILPPSYRRLDTLEIASHVTIISQLDETKLTVFLLDIERLLVR